jgi:hypothetical protein
VEESGIGYSGKEVNRVERSGKEVNKVERS